MLNKIFSLVLLLNLTGLYSFLAPPLKVNFAIISISLLALNCFYIAINYKVARRVFRKKYILYWLVFLIIWPLLTLMYSPIIDYRSIGLQFYYFTLLLATIVYILRNSFKSFHRIISLAIVISIAGFLLSMFKSDLFQSVGAIAGKQTIFQGRGYGFFMQPNSAGRNFPLLFIAWFAGFGRAKAFKTVLLMVLFFVSILLTGSRGGAILAISVLSIIYLDKTVRIQRPFRILLSQKATMGAIATLVCLMVAIPLLVTFLNSYLPEYRAMYGVTDRIESISKMDFAANNSAGKSTISGRLIAIDEFWTMIKKRPILGYGYGTMLFFHKTDKLSRNSHNQYLKIIFETGAFRLIFYLLLLLLIYIHPRRKRIEQLLYTNSYTQFLAAVILAGMFSNALLSSRTFYVILGCFLTFLLFPQETLGNDFFVEQHSIKKNKLSGIHAFNNTKKK